MPEEYTPDWLDDIFLGGSPLPGVDPGAREAAEFGKTTFPEAYKKYRKARSKVGEGLEWLTSPIKPVKEFGERKAKEIEGTAPTSLSDLVKGEKGISEEPFSLKEILAQAYRATPNPLDVVQPWKLPGRLRTGYKLGESIVGGKEGREARKELRKDTAEDVRGATSVFTPLDVITAGGTAGKSKGLTAAMTAAAGAVDALAGGQKIKEGVETSDPGKILEGGLRATLGTGFAGLNLSRVGVKPESVVHKVEQRLLSRLGEEPSETQVGKALMDVTAERGRRSIGGFEDFPTDDLSDLSKKELVILDRMIDGLMQGLRRGTPEGHYKLATPENAPAWMPENMRTVQGAFVRPIAEAYELTKALPKSLRNLVLKRIAGQADNRNLVPDQTTAPAYKEAGAAFERGYRLSEEFSPYGIVKKWISARQAAPFEAQQLKTHSNALESAEDLTKQFKDKANRELYTELEKHGIKPTAEESTAPEELVQDIHGKISQYLRSAPNDILSKGSDLASLMKELRLAAGFQGINTQTRKAALALIGSSKPGSIEQLKNVGVSVRALFSPRWAQKQLHTPEFAQDLTDFVKSGGHPSGHGQILDPGAKKVFSWGSARSWEDLLSDLYSGKDAGEKMNRVRLFSKRVFEDPTYQAVLPYLKTRAWKQWTAQAVKEGVSPKIARREAAEQTGEFFGGLNYDRMFRNKRNQQALQLMLLAPDHYESQGRLGIGAAKTFLDPHNPLGKQYINSMKNLVGTLGLMQVVSYALNDHSTWDNGSGLELSVKLGKDEKGRDRFWRPFGNITDVARIPESVIRSIMEGHPEAIPQTTRSRESGPAGLATSLLSNTDWRGNRIFKEGQTLKNLATVVADTTVPQWLTAPGSYLFGNETLEKSLAESLEESGLQYRQPKGAPLTPKRRPTTSKRPTRR